MCDKMKLLFVCLVALAHQTASEDVIYTLTKEEYSRMPPANHLDHFDHCVQQPRGTFCTAHADLVSDGPSELLHMIKAYSAHVTTHYNYTKLKYGLCLTQTCRQFYNGSESEDDLRVATEACLNHTLAAEYNLKARVTELNCYFEHKSKYSVDWLDRLVVLLLLAIVAANVLGTVYDSSRDETKPGNPMLLAFSIPGNWKQLMSDGPSDPHVELLKPLHGIRVITAILVILGHTPIPLLIASENPVWVEKAYDYPPMHILLQGHLITLTFFLISGFLLAYNFQLIAEKTKFTWKLLPRAILNRFLRVTPICIMALLLTATLMRHTTQGPFWEEIIGWEVRDCRNYWFYNLFYLNNYIDHSQCILQTWYLACDMHLHIIGMAVIVLSPSTRVRWWVMGALYVIGTLWPAYHIYSMDLDATLLANPSTMTSFFISNPTFNYIYKRTHGNMPTFITGMALGYLVYDWQKKNIFSKDLSRYRKFYLLLFPLLLLVTTSAGMLYCGNRPRAPVWARLLFAPIVKPMFVGCVSLTLLGAMFKIDRIYRQSLVWRPWTPLARISYCIFSFHVMVLRFLGGTRTTLNYLSYSHTTHDYIGVTILTIIMATVCYLLVEAPFAQLVRILLSSKPRQKAAVNGANANEAVGNGAAGNGIAGNGTVSNGTVDAVVKNGTANGTAVNGISANGTTLNGTGTTLNGTSFNGSALNGHALKEQVTTAKDKDA